MSQKCSLKPGADTTEFILDFNEMNLGVMAALEMDNESGTYGLVFFKSKNIKHSRLRKFVTWIKNIFC